ncbi:MAG: C-terminal binding protein [Armatimonadota bacterium]
MARELLVVDTTGRTHYPDEALAQIADLPVRLQTVRATEPDEVIAACRDADAILMTAARITREVLMALPRLRAIVRYGVGLDTIDLAAACELGVTVRNVTDFCTDEVADHTLALVLALARGIVDYARHTRAGQWRGGRVRPLLRLRGRRAGIIGLGAIGRAVAARLQALGMEVVASDPAVDAEVARGLGVRLLGLDELLATSEVVCVNCPLTDQTRHLIGADELARMRPTAILVNTARGGIIDETALVQALAEGRIAGAGLDVLEREPPAEDNPLLRMDNVIVTPHVAAASREAGHEVVVGAFRRLAEVLRGV